VGPIWISPGTAPLPIAMSGTYSLGDERNSECRRTKPAQVDFIDGFMMGNGLARLKSPVQIQ
jgi:hypothetical protein